MGSVHYRASLIIGEHRDRAPEANETLAPPATRSRGTSRDELRSSRRSRTRTGCLVLDVPRSEAARLVAAEARARDRDPSRRRRARARTSGSDRSCLRGRRCRRAARDVPPGRRSEAAAQRRCEGGAACDRRRRCVDGDGHRGRRSDRHSGRGTCRRVHPRARPSTSTCGCGGARRPMPWTSRVMPRPSTASGRQPRSDRGIDTPPSPRDGGVLTRLRRRGGRRTYPVPPFDGQPVHGDAAGATPPVNCASADTSDTAPLGSKNFGSALGKPL